MKKNDKESNIEFTVRRVRRGARTEVSTGAALTTWSLRVTNCPACPPPPPPTQ